MTLSDRASAAIECMARIDAKITAGANYRRPNVSSMVSDTRANLAKYGHSTRFTERQLKYLLDIEKKWLRVPKERKAK